MKQKMRLIDNDGSYRFNTTLNKIYEVELVDGHFDNSPYYQFINDDNILTTCHLYRFESLESQNETDDNYDPTPYCNACQAKSQKNCKCGPIAENN